MEAQTFLGRFTVLPETVQLLRDIKTRLEERPVIVKYIGGVGEEIGDGGRYRLSFDPSAREVVALEVVRRHSLVEFGIDSIDAQTVQILRQVSGEPVEPQDLLRIKIRRGWYDKGSWHTVGPISDAL